MFAISRDGRGRGPQISKLLAGVGNFLWTEFLFLKEWKKYDIGNREKIYGFAKNISEEHQNTLGAT